MKKMLFVDDDLKFLEFLKGSKVLNEKYEIFLAHDVDLGLFYAKKEAPDVIFIDIEMPKEGGFGLLSKVRCDEKLKNTHVIVLTAVSSFEVRVQSMRMYCEGFLEKPCSDIDIVDTIEDLYQRVNQ